MTYDVTYFDKISVYVMARTHWHLHGGIEQVGLQALHRTRPRHRLLVRASDGCPANSNSLHSAHGLVAVDVARVVSRADCRAVAGNGVVIGSH
jgi:hypothetical protein